MKIKFLATGQSPDLYSFLGDIITAHKGELSEDFDLSILEEGDEFQSVEPETLDLNGAHIIRDAKRVEGELRVILCQKTSAGHWKESDWMDSGDYDPDTLYIQEVE